MTSQWCVFPVHNETLETEKLDPSRRIIFCVLENFHKKMKNCDFPSQKTHFHTKHGTNWQGEVYFYTHIYKHTNPHTQTHTQTHIHTHTNTHTHTHTHTVTVRVGRRGKWENPGLQQFNNLTQLKVLKVNNEQWNFNLTRVWGIHLTHVESEISVTWRYDLYCQMIVTNFSIIEK